MATHCELAGKSISAKEKESVKLS